jgi:hypothetical protein
VLSLLVLTGCTEIETYGDQQNDSNPVSIGNGIFLKKIEVKGVYVVLQCNEKGDPISVGATTEYKIGKSYRRVSNVPVKFENKSDAKFHFDCDTLEECRDKIDIVSKSMSK